MLASECLSPQSVLPIPGTVFSMPTVNLPPSANLETPLKNYPEFSFQCWFWSSQADNSNCHNY